MNFLLQKIHDTPEHVDTAGDLSYSHPFSDDLRRHVKKLRPLRV